MSEILQPHGGHASEGYGRPKEQGPDFSHGIALYLEKVSVWFDALSYLMGLSTYIDLVFSQFYSLRNPRIERQ